MQHALTLIRSGVLAFQTWRAVRPSMAAIQTLSLISKQVIDIKKIYYKLSNFLIIDIFEHIYPSVYAPCMLCACSIHGPTTLRAWRMHGTCTEHVRSVH